jgi:RNase P subunit RPR2
VVAVVLATLVVALFAWCVWDNRRTDRRFAEALARLHCAQCGVPYGPVAAASRRWAGITGPPAFLVRCPSCGKEAVRALRSWVDP